MPADDLPPHLQNLLTVVVGQPWPEGNVDELRQLARAWHQFGDDLESVIGRFVSVGRDLHAGMAGDVRG